MPKPKENTLINELKYISRCPSIGRDATEHATQRHYVLQKGLQQMLH
ncbi:hypothetical protein NSE_0116 [Neorickettsia sennetsu str. Miyayama]|uniref:Uncharacterized protein n=1 Tax=Ehrlichia sennetsu (strain ATCC VR-367 / Miyayama) TaxID=222891 RepID=Q2GET0_EHRS3|nr:hypothetical protein NSE_0116 [Neorickettsia sennetsu str. Miyayama]